jgi:tRNA G37 N-methylase Trm5
MPGNNFKSKSIQGKHDYKFYEFEHNSSTYTFVDEEIVRERFFYPYLKAGMVVLDIGAGYGSYTLPALARGCIIHAVNLYHENYYHLEQNIKLNNFDDDDKFKHYGFAISSKDGKIEAGGKKNVICRTIDTLFLTLPEKIDYIKLDVEGYELEALKGAKQTIIKNKPIILCENHLFMDASLEEKCIDFIDSLRLGYKWENRPYHAISHTLFLPYLVLNP